MRLAASVSFAFLLGSISVSAQNAGVGMAGAQGLSNAPVLLPAQNVNAGCPVRLRAQHGADGTMRKVDKSRPDGIAQKLHLTLTGNDSRQITEAGLRVRGASGKGQVSRTDTALNSMDYTRNVTVKLTQGAENEATGDVWVPGMSAVLEVELNFVKFADGGMQSFGSSQGCRFTPEHLMLIAKDSD
jgi:hypothetical protein